jgi:hypothetical protein
MPTIINPKNIYEYMGASYRINTNLQVQNSFYIGCKFIQTGSYGGYKASHKVRGFFNATQRRKLAFVSWGALKKPKANEV